MNAEQIQALLDGATDGPWRLGSWGDNVFGTGPNDEWLTICRVKRDDAPIEESRDAIDARLIAAAPDLAQAALTAMAERDALQLARDRATELWANVSAERDALQARVAELEAFVGEFAEAKFEPLPRPPVRSPEDEPDPATDATTVWAWQEDARALLSKGSPDADA
jgi:hypothetical protein